TERPSPRSTRGRSAWNNAYSNPPRGGLCARSRSGFLPTMAEDEERESHDLAEEIAAVKRSLQAAGERAVQRQVTIDRIAADLERIERELTRIRTERKLVAD